MRFLMLVSVLFVIGGCSHHKMFTYHVESEPSGGLVEINGVYIGETPTTIELGDNKVWVGILYAPGGWRSGQTPYNVTVYPPKGEAGNGLTSQTKMIVPGTTADGATLYYDLRLTAVQAVQRIEITEKK